MYIKFLNYYMVMCQICDNIFVMFNDYTLFSDVSLSELIIPLNLGCF